jgi:hypothetical protein
MQHEASSLAVHGTTTKVFRLSAEDLIVSTCALSCYTREPRKRPFENCVSFAILSGSWSVESDDIMLTCLDSYRRAVNSKPSFTTCNVAFCGGYQIRSCPTFVYWWWDIYRSFNFLTIKRIIDSICLTQHRHAKSSQAWKVLPLQRETQNAAAIYH